MGACVVWVFVVVVDCGGWNGCFCGVFVFPRRITRITGVDVSSALFFWTIIFDIAWSFGRVVLLVVCFVRFWAFLIA